MKKIMLFLVTSCVLFLCFSFTAAKSKTVKGYFSDPVKNQKIGFVIKNFDNNRVVVGITPDVERSKFTVEELENSIRNGISSLKNASIQSVAKFDGDKSVFNLVVTPLETVGVRGNMGQIIAAIASINHWTMEVTPEDKE